MGNEISVLSLNESDGRAGHPENGECDERDLGGEAAVGVKAHQQARRAGYKQNVGNIYVAEGTVQPRVKVTDIFGKLCETGEQHPHTGVNMHEESKAPVVDIDVILLDPQKADVRVVRQVGDGDPRHQESEKSERHEQQGVKAVKTLEKKSGFQHNTCHETDNDLAHYRAFYRFRPVRLQAQQYGLDHDR